MYRNIIAFKHSPFIYVYAYTRALINTNTNTIWVRRFPFPQFGNCKTHSQTCRSSSHATLYNFLFSATLYWYYVYIYSPSNQNTITKVLNEWHIFTLTIAFDLRLPLLWTSSHISWFSGPSQAIRTTIMCLYGLRVYMYLLLALPVSVRNRGVQVYEYCYGTMLPSFVHYLLSFDASLFLLL